MVRQLQAIIVEYFYKTNNKFWMTALLKVPMVAFSKIARKIIVDLLCPLQKIKFQNL